MCPLSIRSDQCVVGSMHSQIWAHRVGPHAELVCGCNLVIWPNCTCVPALHAWIQLCTGLIKYNLMHRAHGAPQRPGHPVQQTNPMPLIWPLGPEGWTPLVGLEYTAVMVQIRSSRYWQDSYCIFAKAIQFQLLLLFIYQQRYALQAC